MADFPTDRPKFNRPTKKSRPVPNGVGRFQAYRGVVLVALGALVLWMNVTFLIPVTMGGIFAIVLYPLMGRLGKIGIKHRAWQALILTVFFAFSFLLPLGTIIFLGAQETLDRIQAAQEAGAEAVIFSPAALIETLGLRPLIERFADFAQVSETQITQLTTRAMTQFGAWLAKFLQSLLSSVPKAGFSMFITLLSIFFFLVDGQRTVRFIRENSFFGPRETDKVLHAVSSLCYSVVVASIAAGSVQAALITLSCWMTGTPKAVLIGLVAFILSFLPMVGTLPVTLGLTLNALIQKDFFATVVFAAFIGIVGISDNIVRPWVLRGGASLHPLIGFVAAFGALDTIGFYGVFIGPVVAGLFFTLLPIVARSYPDQMQRIQTRVESGSRR